MERDARRRLSTANATYVSPSATKKLRLGAKIGYLFTLNVSKPYFLQRLTDRTHFFNGGFYTTAFYVGDEGVLLLDVPEKQGAKVLQAIAEVTTLPMTAIVYSHNHADHIIDTPVILDASSVAGVKGVRIIASTATNTKMKLLKCNPPSAQRDGGVAEWLLPVRTSHRPPHRLYTRGALR